MIRKRVHCRMSTLATVNSVTAATRTVVIFSSRRYPPESSSKTAASVVSAAQKYSWWVSKIRLPRRAQDARRPRRSACDAPGNAMWAAWPTVPSIAAICACVVSSHEEPEPAEPRDARPRAGQRVERRQRRLAVRDRVAAELDLHEDLDDAGEQDQPEQAEARLGAQAGRVDQLARPDDRGGQDQPRPDLPDRLGRACAGAP